MRFSITKIAIASLLFIGTAAPSFGATALDESARSEHIQLAQTAESQGDMRTALHEYNEALRFCSSSSSLNIRLQRAFVRYSLGDTRGALRDINAVRAANPAALNSYGNIAMMEAEVGDHKAALIDFTVQLATAQSEPGLQQRSFWLWQRAITKIQLCDTTGALQDLDAALLDADQFASPIAQFRNEVLSKSHTPKVQSAQSRRSAPSA